MARAKGTSIAWRMAGRSCTAGGARFSTAGGHQAEAHDSFLWSLADLMTLLLVFFIMLYANAAAPLREDAVKEREIERNAPPTGGDSTMGVFPQRSLKMPILDEADSDAQDMPAESPAAEKMPASPPSENLPADTDPRREMLADLEDRFNRDFYVRWEDRQPVIVLGERITFNAGEATLLFEARDTLGQVARMINNLDSCQVVVTGHTDDRPIHTRVFPSNWELSAARAASVAKALMESGVPPDRLVIQGLSQFKPLAPNTSADNRRRNRRVEISLITG